jgi:hypothetical protein
MRFGLLLSLFLIGCAKVTDTCGNKVLLPWPDANGNYKMQEIVLNTLSEVTRLRGSAAEVYFENGLDESGFHGTIAEPHVTRAGDTCVPTDVDSSLALSAYAQFEKLQDFERDLGSDTQISWPRKVGVNIHLRGDPSDTHNQAKYFGGQDVITLLPYDRAGLPVAFNHGITAHEHFHSHFQKVVLNALKWARQVIGMGDLLIPQELQIGRMIDENESDTSSARGINNWVLRGWNEGLADFFAGVYTGRADFFVPSLSDTRILARRLDLPLHALATSEAFQESASKARGNEMALSSLSYGEGALLARLMFALAHSGMAPPREFLSQVMFNLKALPEMANPEMSRQVLDGASLLPVLLNGLPVNPRSCSLLRDSAGQERVTKGFAQCTGI